MKGWIIESTLGYCFSFHPKEKFWHDERGNLEFSSLRDVIEYLMGIDGHSIVITQI